MTLQETKISLRVKKIEANKDDCIVLTTTCARSSIFLPGDQYYLIGTSPLVDGFNMLLEQHYHVINAINGDKNYTSLVEENRMLKDKLLQISRFERGERITIGTLSYQKAINENSFYKAITTDL